MIRSPFRALYDGAWLAACCLGVASIGTRATTAQAFERLWREVPTIDASYDHAMAYDAARQRIVLFGGQTHMVRSAMGRTWLFGPAGWDLAAATASPSSRYGHCMSYDAARQRVVLFGGVAQVGSSSALDGQTWEWDGTGWIFRTSASSPSPRRNAAMAHDAARGVTVLFGGSPTGLSGVDDTWIWNGSFWQWVNPPIKPPWRTGHAMAYDPVRQRVLLYGGEHNGTTGDTWEWNGTTWAEIPAATPPPPRTRHSLAYDPALGKIVLLGGTARSNQPLADAWAWDGSNWAPLAAGPRARAGHAMAHHAALGSVVLYGGFTLPQGSTTPAELNETWSFASGSWSLVPYDSPPAREGSALAYDRSRARVVMFGGIHEISINPGRNLNDTWEWDGARWIERTPAVAPTPRNGHALTFDEARGTCVLFGGYPTSNDTWTWDGVTWTQQNPATSPPPRQYAEMVYDARRQRVWLFSGVDAGGTYLNDLWEWDGFTWTPHPTGPAPTGRRFFGMAYDVARDRIVVFGGRDFQGTGNNQTWEFDGTAWYLKTVAFPPSARTSNALVYDSVLGRTLLFGGDPGLGAPGFQFREWNGFDWSAVAFPLEPPLGPCEGAYDRAREEALWFNGSKTWILAPTGIASSGLIGNACLGTLGAPVIDASSPPALGNLGFAIALSSVCPSAPIGILIGSELAYVPLAPSCAIHFLPSANVLATTSTPAGTATYPLPLPGDPALFGADAYLQAAVADPLGSIGGVISITAALRLSLGF